MSQTYNKNKYNMKKYSKFEFDLRKLLLTFLKSEHQQVANKIIYKFYIWSFHIF
jgi:hypothetical protein